MTGQPLPEINGCRGARDAAVVAGATVTLDRPGHHLLARAEREPRRLTGFNFMRIFIQGGVPHRIVPEDHWSAEEDPPGELAAYLACQCGASHRVEAGRFPQSCTCQRWFFFDGTAVWALLSPAP